jgi:transposase
MRPVRTADQKEESMNRVSHSAIIGIDVSRDWLDIHCLPDDYRLRLPNTAVGHAQLADLARDRRALVCFESTGGQEWLLWAVLDNAGIPTRQLPPAQIKAFAVSRGTRAKTDRIDAELIARFMAFRPEAGRCLPHEKLRLSEP